MHNNAHAGVWASSAAHIELCRNLLHHGLSEGVVVEEVGTTATLSARPLPSARPRFSNPASPSTSTLQVGTTATLSANLVYLSLIHI